MRKKQEEETKETGKKEVKKRRRITRFKVKRFLVGGCWLVAAASLAFGVYKNFTAVDTVTVRDTQTVTERIENYVGLETFTEDFARIYFAYSPDSAAQTAKTEELKNYMQPDLVSLNQGNTYTAGAVTVQDVKIWEVSAMEEEGNFTILFTVTQQAGEITEESAFTVTVHNEGQEYVVVENPAVAALPSLSDYQEERLSSSDLVSAADREAVTAFLDTFFTVYPKASAHELAYYVRDEEVKPVLKDYTLLSVDNVVIAFPEEGGYTVACDVTYMDNTLGVQVISQYEMDLSSQDNGELIIMDLR